MKAFVPGQRWISITEPELGLGVLTGVDRRSIHIRFETGQCSRMYTLSNPPVQRVVFAAGDRVPLKNGRTVTITGCDSRNGLNTYTCADASFGETEISDRLTVSLPDNRLLAGITDSNKLFDLKFKTLGARAGYDASGVKGFMGGQIELLPHQFYIADTITSRFSHRVLLADETGLGKTIEACLVVHKLLISHLITRVLIVVPHSLQHQWFIELYRKFSLSFMIMKEEYCKSIIKRDPSLNPFHQHQLVIVSMDQLKDDRYAGSIRKAGWDMVVIDEAHHVCRSPALYQTAGFLAAETQGLMLLTATPEQMGKKNHFLTLKLIDPDKYFDFNTYCRQSEQYQAISDQLENHEPGSPEFANILDTYGPGRVIFRNKRKQVKGFPGRATHIYPLNGKLKDRQQSSREALTVEGDDAYPLNQDPRIDCLVKLIKKKEKILVICQSREKVSGVVSAVNKKIHTDIARFDESMTLIQRDRNAAWFAEPDGAKILICSEIGSEGRNFQFVHHLFLFDLPLNPELLEQRIGRLDRIGQKKEIHIHAPFICDSGMEIIVRWCHEGLDILNHHGDGAHMIFTRFQERLIKLMKSTLETKKIDRSALEHLIQETRHACLRNKNQMEKGRNRLLAFNSFKPAAAREIIHKVAGMDNHLMLSDLMTRIWDAYGIEVEPFADPIFRLNGDTITDEEFPMPQFHSNAMTFHRKTAIARDEIEFFTWDHPFIHQTLEYFLTSPVGTTALAQLPGQDETGLLIETVYTLQCIAPPRLNMELFLPPEPVRILVDHTLNPVFRFGDADLFSSMLKPDQPYWFKEMNQIRDELLAGMIKTSEKIAREKSEKAINTGSLKIKSLLDPEIRRLLELKTINPGIRDQEIDHAQNLLKERLNAIQNTQPRLSAIRLIRLMPSE